MNEHALFVGWYDYVRAVGRLPLEAQVFKVWYFSLYSEKLDPAVDLTPYRTFFPNLKDKTRAYQKKDGAPLQPGIIIVMFLLPLMMIVIVVVVIVVVVMFAAAGVAAYELTIHKPTFQSGLLGRCGKRWRLGMW